MSQQNVELWRASIEAEFSFRADRSEFDPEATISKMAELWDPELEVRRGRIPVVKLGRRYRFRREAIEEWLREVEAGNGR